MSPRTGGSRRKKQMGLRARRRLDAHQIRTKNQEDATGTDLAALLWEQEVAGSNPVTPMSDEPPRCGGLSLESRETARYEGGSLTTDCQQLPQTGRLHAWTRPATQHRPATIADDTGRSRSRMSARRRGLLDRIVVRPDLHPDGNARVGPRCEPDDLRQRKRRSSSP